MSLYEETGLDQNQRQRIKNILELIQTRLISSYDCLFCGAGPSESCINHPGLCCSHLIALRLPVNHRR